MTNSVTLSAAEKLRVYAATGFDYTMPPRSCRALATEIERVEHAARAAREDAVAAKAAARVAREKQRLAEIHTASVTIGIYAALEIARGLL